MAIDYTVNEVGDGKVEISAEYLESLQDSERKLLTLESYGVDNWGGYDDAMTEYYSEDDED